MWQWLKKLTHSDREFRTYRVSRCSALCPFHSSASYKDNATCCYPGQGARDIPFSPFGKTPEWCPLRRQTLAVYYEAPSE